MSSRRTHTNRTPAFPEKPTAKQEGGNYGGARRAEVKNTPDEPEKTSVQQAFDNPDNRPWEHRIGGRVSVSDMRAVSTSRDTGGWAK